MKPTILSKSGALPVEGNVKIRPESLFGLGKFGTITADPPWHYNDQYEIGATRYYHTMSLEEIKSLPVNEIAMKDSHLYLWVTNAFVKEGHDVCRCWGFEPKTLLTWVKTGKDGQVVFGMGYYFRGATEHVIFATRGKLRTLDRSIPTVFFAPRCAHSVKPAKFYRIVEKMSPWQRIELFARKPREGWMTWGEEVDVTKGGK